MLDFQSDLNDRQRRAVEHVQGALLVIAGAGSGKTRVITYRVANLIRNHRVPPWRILAVTFTNKAAKEMRERIEQLVGERARDCWIATFHAGCARLLRAHAEQAGVKKNFTIYDDADQKAMVVRCLKELGFNEKKFQPRPIQNEINRAKQELIGVDEYEAGDFYRERVKLVYELYEKKMRAAGALDFGDLLYRMVRGMRENPELQEAVAGRYDYVLVDEFQDTNRVQLELVRRLTAPHGNVCVVGDDDQSIYSWRGADVTNILEFERFFPGAASVTLDRNYRSTGNILAGAHAVVSRLAGRREKELWTDANDGEPVGLIAAPDEREEARLVARAIGDLREDGYGLNEQAVFYRINAQSRVFEEVFRTMGIPHRVVGGMRFYERAEVKDILSYLRLIQNTDDLAAFLRIVNTPVRGIGKATVDKLMAIAAAEGLSAFEAITLARERIGNGPGKKLEAFAAMVEGWRAEIENGPALLAQRVLEDTGYTAGLERQNSAEADARLENLKELVGSIEDFEREAETPSLESFLELIALQTDVDTADFADEQVTLMTVHAAKGLEFDVVHVTGLEEGLFPYQRGGARTIFDADPDELDEERRLCYVAMTRARKRLFLTRANDRRIFGQVRREPASRFLGELPPDVVVDLSPVRPRASLVDRPRGASRHSQRPVLGRPLAARKKPAGPAEPWVDESFDQSVREIAPRPGTQVRHSRFGVGEVIGVVAGARIKVEVDFPVYGRKTIVADYLEWG